MKVYGHRGVIYSDRPPYQNSLQAFKKALKVSDGFECDVCRSVDGELFLIHEAKYYRNDVGVEYCAEEHLDQASKKLIGDQKIEDMPTSDVRKLRLIDGQPIPTLDETISLFTGTGKTLILELKGQGVVTILAGHLKKAFADGEIKPEQVVIVSFNHPDLIKAKQLLPNVKIGATFVKEDQPTAPLFPWLAGAEASVYTSFQPQTAEKAIREIQPDYIILPHQELNSQTMIDMAKKHPDIGIMIWVFTETIDLTAEESLDKGDFLKSAKEGMERHNLIGMMVDYPENTPLYKDFFKR